jgi:tRNA pseudouridine38-40 synthase
VIPSLVPRVHWSFNPGYLSQSLFAGANYNGLQRNPGVVTVESVLEKAIVAAGILVFMLYKLIIPSHGGFSGGITADNAGSFNKVSWQSTARTDKGVSAVGNCIAFKAVMVPNLKEEIQKHLPSDIRVFGTLTALP